MLRKSLFIAAIVVAIAIGYLYYIAPWSRSWAGFQGVKELRIAISTDISTLDISYATGVSDFEVLGKVYESLFRIDYVDGKLVYIPWLVESYTMVNNSYWLFTLRKNIKFHNGELLTSWDVKASIERSMEISPIGRMLLRDGDGRPIIDDIIVYNETVFALRLRKPFTPLIEHLAHLSIAIMPRSVVERFRNGRIDGIDSVVGTGPYRLVEYVRGQYIKLQRFNEYWGVKPIIKDIVYVIILAPDTRVAALETQEVDIATAIPPEQALRLKQKGYIVYNETGVRFVIAAINIQRISDARIRKAMNYAVDRKAIVDRLMDGFAVVAKSIVSPIFPGAVYLEPYSYSVEKAKQLIEEAGGINKTLILLVSTRSPKDIELAQVLQNYLLAIGIDVEIQPMEHTAFLKRVFTDHDFDLAIYGPSPSSLHYALTYWRSGAALNAPLYSNPEVDRLLDEAARESNIERRYQLYERVQDIIWSECPAIWLYYENIIVATRPGVEGLKILPFQILILDNVSIRG